MNNNPIAQLADVPASIAAIYEDADIATSYLEKRMQFAWQRLLHREQVAVLNAVIQRYRPLAALELAPGPARLAVELRGIQRGVMVENSAEMLGIAKRRLSGAQLSDVWSVSQGDAFALEKSIAASDFDLAYTFRFIRHFRDAERAQLYAQIRERLAPRGKLVFDVVNAAIRDPIEARQQARPNGEIPIYDVTYTKRSFVAELHAAGFTVLAMHPVIRHFGAQSWLSYQIAHRAPVAVETAVRVLEKLPTARPLEWVAVCEKR